MSLKIDDVVMISCSEGSWITKEHQEWAFGTLAIVIGVSDEMVRVEHCNEMGWEMGYYYAEDCVTKIGVL